jgi:hypothetical protein
MRAFIFSLDAFVAFTLALVAIYSLIFFSSIPSSYYYLLTQGHYLSRDVLMALSTTTCTNDYGVCKSPGGSLIDNIVSQDDTNHQENLIQNTVGEMVPNQFGYVVEFSNNQGGSWDVLYDTSQASGDLHAKQRKKLSVSSQVITFGYSGAVMKPANSTYKYLTCGTSASPILTCGDSGKKNPSDLFGDLVPSTEAGILRLTIFI